MDGSSVSLETENTNRVDGNALSIEASTVNPIATKPIDNQALEYLKLSLTPGLGARKIKVLSDHFGNAAKILSATNKELAEVAGVGPKLIQSINEHRDNVEADKEIKRAGHLGIDIISIVDTRYPQALREIFDPPPVIYVLGELPKQVLCGYENLRSIAIVGTRDASDYGLDLSKQLAKDFAEADIAVISGLALGVDSAAHQGSLQVTGEQKGQTVAVLGSSLDHIYPNKNQNLAKQITEGHGAVISEYRIGTKPHAQNFPGRNRIINGLSKGVIVVEAGERSGALITADYALDEGRTVFAVPGRPSDKHAKGALKLLKQGAVLTQAASDVFEEFDWQAADGREQNKEKLSQLDPAQLEIVKVIASHGEPLLDDLIVLTKETAAALLPKLSILALKGIVKKLPNERYINLYSLD